MRQFIYFILFILALISSGVVLAQASSDTASIYVQIEIMGLACPYCAYGMEKELKKMAGAENIQIELEEGLAYISTPINKKPSQDELRKIISDAGFTPGEILFSKEPFKRSLPPRRVKKE